MITSNTVFFLYNLKYTHYHGMTPGMKPGLATTLTRGARWLQETKQTTYWQTLLAVQKIRQRDSNLQPSGLKSDKLPVTLQEPCFIGILPLNISLCFGCALKVVFCTLTLWNSDKPGSAKKNSGSISFGTLTLWNSDGPGFAKLDDGWPESVEEQGLLLLVLRRYITRQYIEDQL